jgi:hypothetical protein
MATFAGHATPAMQLPSPTETRLPTVVGSLTILLGLALLTYGLRIYSRSYPYSILGWDDHMMSIAVVVTVINYALTIALITASQGKHIEYVSLSTIVYITKIAYFSRFLWVWSVTTIKTSVALMILRIKQSPAWRIGIFCLVATLLVLGIGQTIALLVQCRPIRDNWALVNEGNCWNQDLQNKITYTSSGISNPPSLHFPPFPKVLKPKISPTWN